MKAARESMMKCSGRRHRVGDIPVQRSRQHKLAHQHLLHPELAVKGLSSFTKTGNMCGHALRIVKAAWRAPLNIDLSMRSSARGCTHDVCQACPPHAVLGMTCQAGCAECDGRGGSR